MPTDQGIYSADQVGVLPDIHGKYTLLEMAKTPFTSMLRTAPTPSTIQSLYHARLLRAVKRTGRLEGKDVDSFQVRTRLEVNARGQAFGGDETSFRVSDLAAWNKLAGNLDELAFQKAEALLELKRQMESQFLSNDDSAAEAGATPNTTRGVFKWGSTSAQGHLPVHADLRPVAAQSLSGVLNTTNWNEEILLTGLRTCFDQRNEEVDLVGLVGSALMATMQDWAVRKKDVANYSPILSVNRDGTRAGEAIFPIVEVIGCVFGSVKLKTSGELLRDADGLVTTGSRTAGVFLDPDLWELAYHEAIHTLEMPNLGGGKRGAHFAGAQLRCLHPQGQMYLNFTSS